MGVIAMVLGVSGTGKTTSLRNFKSDDIAFVNVTGKPLPFKGRFSEMICTDDYKKIKDFIRKTNKTSIVIDDVQYLMGNEFMRRITEKGWDRFNEIAFSLNDLLDFIAYDVAENKIVYLLGHTEKDADGNEKFKTMGKAIDSCICVEGKVFIVLKTGVIDGKYYFYTQNSGKDTVKSPLGMFSTYAIDNDLKYVDEKIRNYYEIGEYKTDDEIAQADAAVAADVEKPDANGRRSRSRKTPPVEQIETPPTTPPDEKPKGRTRKSREEVQKENTEKLEKYMEEQEKAVDAITNGREEIPFDEACEAADTVPKPDLEKPPRRTRKDRKTAEQTEPETDGTTNTDSETVVLNADTYFYIPADDNYVLKHKGDTVDLTVGGKEVARVITKEEFNEGCKRIAQGTANPVEGAMNPPETPVRGQRRRRTR